MASGPKPDVDDVHREAARCLAAVGHRYTRGRRDLVAVLASAKRPLTLPEIVEAAANLPQSSAYRHLASLEVGGVVRRISVGADRARFELAEPLLSHHHHLICVACGDVGDVHLAGALEEAVDAALDAAAREVGFTPSHHVLDLYGHCSNCPSES